MHHRIGVALSTLGIAAVFGLSEIAPAAAHERAQPNVMEVIVGNGPLAGTYKPPRTEVICMHSKQQKMYTAAFKDFAPKSAKSMAEAGINVMNADAAGAKRGDIRIAFGDPAKKQTVYAAEQVPLTLTRNGPGADIAFTGKTKDGIELRITAKCSDVDLL
jgi:hypothetical protein